MSWVKNSFGVKDGADCYRTIAGVRWSWWPEDSSVFKAANIRHRRAPGGEGTFVHPDDDAAAQAAVNARTALASLTGEGQG